MTTHLRMFTLALFEVVSLAPLSKSTIKLPYKIGGRGYFLGLTYKSGSDTS